MTSTPPCAVGATSERGAPTPSAPAIQTRGGSWARSTTPQETPPPPTSRPSPAEGVYSAVIRHAARGAAKCRPLVARSPARYCAGDVAGERGDREGFHRRAQP